MQLTIELQTERKDRIEASKLSNEARNKVVRGNTQDLMKKFESKNETSQSSYK